MPPPPLALVVVAHADDETIGCGGTIAHLVRIGWTVDVVVVSSGIVTARGHDQDNREDAAAACATLGATSPQFLGFPDQAFDTRPITELASALEHLGREPRLVITHGDGDLNRDHRLTSEAVRIAFRAVERPVSILEFASPDSAPWNGAFGPIEYYVDISETLPVKLAALAVYRNEVRSEPHPASPPRLSSLAHVLGSHIGVRAAEGFHVRRAIAGQLP